MLKVGRPGECTLEKDCWWIAFRPPLRQPSSKSKKLGRCSPLRSSKCQSPPVSLKTKLTRPICRHQDAPILLGWNHVLYHVQRFHAFWKQATGSTPTIELDSFHWTYIQRFSTEISFSSQLVKPDMRGVFVRIIFKDKTIYKIVRFGTLSCISKVKTIFRQNFSYVLFRYSFIAGILFHHHVKARMHVQILHVAIVKLVYAINPQQSMQQDIHFWVVSVCPPCSRRPPIHTPKYQSRGTKSPIQTDIEAGRQAVVGSLWGQGGLHV